MSPSSILYSYFILFPSVSLYVVVFSSPASVVIFNVGAVSSVISSFVSVPYTFSVYVTSNVIVSPALYIPVFGVVISIFSISGLVLSNIYGPVIICSSVLFPSLSSICFTIMYLVPVIPVPIVNPSPDLYSIHSPPSAVLGLVDR